MAVAAAALLLAAAVAALSGSAAGSEPGVTIATAAGPRLAFDPAETTVAAGSSIVVTLRNASSVPHNLVFVDGSGAGTRTIVEPDTSDEFTLDVSAPGTYPFVCTIHDGMAGAIIVEEQRGDR